MAHNLWAKAFTAQRGQKSICRAQNILLQWMLPMCNTFILQNVETGDKIAPNDIVLKTSLIKIGFFAKFE